MGRGRGSGSCSHLLIPSLNFDEWRKIDEFTFVIGLEILNEFDEAGNIMNAGDDWKEIMDANKNDSEAVNAAESSKGTSSSKEAAEAVRVWMKEVVELEQYSDLLIRNGYDNMKAIAAVKNSDLQRIGVDLIGHRKQIALFAEHEKNKMFVVESAKMREKSDEKKKEECGIDGDVNEVDEWLCKEMKLPHLCKLFRDEVISDFETVKCLDAATLNELSKYHKITYGDKLALLKGIERMKNDGRMRGRYVAIGCGLCLLVGFAYYYSTKRRSERRKS